MIYECPANGPTFCSWEGSAEDIKEHFETAHCDFYADTNAIEINLKRLPEHKILHLKEEIFLLQNQIEDGKLSLKLRYLGSNEEATRFHYSITIFVKGIFYKYHPSRYFSCIVPTKDSWQVNLECLEKFHGTIDKIECVILLNFPELIDEAEVLNALEVVQSRIDRLKREQSLENEAEIESTDEINKLSQSDDQRISTLKRKDSSRRKKQQNRDSSDAMDNISHLNLDIFESSDVEESKSSSEFLPNIPEELNLYCTSCHLEMIPPIFYCISSHNICNSCKYLPCKLCNSPVTDKRNKELEEKSRNHMHSCRYSTEGCNEKLKYNELLAHELKCRYYKYKCMSCTYEGKFDNLLHHLKVVHSSIKLCYVKNFEFPKNSEMYVVNETIGIFHCKSVSTNDAITWRATVCGPSERRFYFELRLKGSKYKEPIFLKRSESGEAYEIRKSLDELKKNKAKAKYATLTVGSYDS